MYFECHKIKFETENWMSVFLTKSEAPAIALCHCNVAAKVDPMKCRSY